MKIISTRVNDILDHTMGFVLLATPLLLGFPPGAETMVLVLLGMAMVISSMLTRYDNSLWPVISLRVHLFLDEMGGVFLAASPWLFGFADRVYLPHVVLGVAQIAVALLTKTQRQHMKKVSHA